MPQQRATETKGGWAMGLGLGTGIQVRANGGSKGSPGARGWAMGLGLGKGKGGGLKGQDSHTI